MRDLLNVVLRADLGLPLPVHQFDMPTAREVVMDRLQEFVQALHGGQAAQHAQHQHQQGFQTWHGGHAAQPPQQQGPPWHGGGQAAQPPTWQQEQPGQWQQGQQCQGTWTSQGASSHSRQDDWHGSQKQQGKESLGRLGQDMQQQRRRP